MPADELHVKASHPEKICYTAAEKLPFGPNATILESGISEERIRQIVREEIMAWEIRQLRSVRSRGFLIDIETKGSK